MEVDIYDFDKTVVPFDSGSTFLLFCVKRYPYLLLLLPYYLALGLLYGLRIFTLDPALSTLTNQLKGVAGVENVAYIDQLLSDGDDFRHNTRTFKGELINYDKLAGQDKA